MAARHVLYGAVAAAAASAIALDATLGKPSNWPVFHKMFDGDWQVARNLSYALLSIVAAFFGYLALNLKNGVKHE
ncbi:MAG: hypothetical protein WAK55_17380 [Xanthobacteraceae bacterium]